MGVPKPVPRSILIARARRGGKGPSPLALDMHRATVMIPYYNDPTMTWRERKELKVGTLSRRERDLAGL